MAKRTRDEGRAFRSRRWQGRFFAFALTWGLGAWGLGACAGRTENSLERQRPMTDMKRDSTIRKAIRSSSDGVIVLPSKKAESVYELPRLNEIAQGLRRPGMECFVRRALETMEIAQDPADGFVRVPDGQLKLRVRINAEGKVLRTEILETGFEEQVVPECFSRAVRTQRFPESRSGNAHFVDIVYWVSLGMVADVRSRELQELVRRQKTAAAVRAKPCLQNRVAPGSYTVAGLNLVGRDGATLANRVDQASFPEDVLRCVAQAFREIRLGIDSESFVRPVLAQVRFDVAAGGEVGVQDEEWLRLVQMEERARQAVAPADGSGDEAPRRPKYVDEGEPEIEEDAPVERSILPPSDGTTTEPRPEPAGAAGPPLNRTERGSDRARGPERDPGEAGLKIRLGTRDDPSTGDAATREVELDQADVDS